MERTARATLLAALLGSAACTGGGDAPAPGPAPGPAPAAPAAAAPAAAAPAPAATDERGIVRYDGYAAAIARPGDTVASVAARAGVPAAALAAYNGLREASTVRAGDELILPPEYGG